MKKALTILVGIVITIIALLIAGIKIAAYIAIIST